MKILATDNKYLKHVAKRWLKHNTANRTGFILVSATRLNQLFSIAEKMS